MGLIKHAGWPDVELAWHLFDGAAGQGFATEAAMAVKTWARQDMGPGGSGSGQAPQLHRREQYAVAGGGKTAWRRHGRDAGTA